MFLLANTRKFARLIFPSFTGTRSNKIALEISLIRHRLQLPYLSRGNQLRAVPTLASRLYERVRNLQKRKRNLFP